MKDSGKRYIGLDVHKHYLIAIGVDDELNVVLPARRVELSRLEFVDEEDTHEAGRCGARNDDQHLAVV